MRYHITLKSANAKVGPIPVSTTGADSCPIACPLRSATIHGDGDGGCYAGGGPLALHWRKITNGERGTDLAEFCDTVRTFPAGQLWRHNQAGDLPHAGDHVTLAAGAVAAIVNANEGKRGFTYTHYDIARNADNRAIVAWANHMGFTVNASANDPDHADRIADAAPGLPICTLYNGGPDWKTARTAGGRTITRCPAEYRDTNCAECKLCAVADRRAIVGFTPHGASKKRAIAAMGD